MVVGGGGGGVAWVSGEVQNHSFRSNLQLELRMLLLLVGTTKFIYLIIYLFYTLFFKL